MPDKPRLFSVTDAARLVGRSEKTIRRWCQLSGVRSELRRVQSESGRIVQARFVDVTTLPCELPEDFDLEPVNRSNGGEPLVEIESLPLEAGLEVVADAPEEHRTRLIAELAAKHGVSKRTVYRRLKRLGSKSVNLVRADAGSHRIPQRAYAAIVAALVSNEREVSTRMIHRTLMRAVPQDMTYERGGVDQVVSVQTVGRIRKALMEDPNTRLLFSDTDAREEYMRTYSGAIVAAHANQIWYADMTRCDVMVIDPSTGATFRPRVHVTIDIYSGCVPGIVFSKEEDQAQTDLLLLRSLLPKRGPWAHKYPVFGIPENLRTDNGSIYKSMQTRRATAGVGTRMIFGMVGRSHAGGPVERFFGSLHNFEKSLVGYVGPNAVARSTKEMKRLERNAKEWLKHGRDPGQTNRLMTIGEYQEAMLTWLVAEYHQWDVGGETRLERFVGTAPESTLLQLDEQELLLHLAHRVERTVDPAGQIRLNNRLWTVLDGSLAKYQGTRVTILTDQFALEPDRHLVAWQDRSGRLNVIGELQPAPELAKSIEAQDHRRASHAVLLEEKRRQRELKRDLTNPHLRISNVLKKEFYVAAEPELEGGARAQLEAVRGRELVEPAPDDELGRAIAALQQPKFGPDTDPADIVRWHNRRGERGRDD